MKAQTGIKYRTKRGDKYYPIDLADLTETELRTHLDSAEHACNVVKALLKIINDNLVVPLKENDRVLYHNGRNKHQEGYITSIKGSFIFVCFDDTGRGQACNMSQLTKL